eukprot:3657579-Pleurochrysis_carterae.AAC.2
MLLHYCVKQVSELILPDVVRQVSIHDFRLMINLQSWRDMAFADAVACWRAPSRYDPQRPERNFAAIGANANRPSGGSAAALLQAALTARQPGRPA